MSETNRNDYLLLVEDTDWLAEQAAEALTERGWTVLVATSAAEAGVLAEGHNLAVVLCDWDLGPGQPTGDAIVEQVRGIRPGTRCFIWSGLERSVPEGVTFLLKDSFAAVFDAIGGPDSARSQSDG